VSVLSAQTIGASLRSGHAKSIWWFWLNPLICERLRNVSPVRLFSRSVNTIANQLPLPR